MTTIEHIWSILTSGVTGAIAAWVAQNFFVERLRLAVAHDYALKLESHKAEIQRDMTRQLDLVRADFEERGRLHRERWQIKRDACLAALRIVDSVLTNIPWENSTRPETHLRVKSLPVEAQEARDAMNRLILSCDRPEVVLLFLKAVGLTESGETAAVVDTNTVQEL